MTTKQFTVGAPDAGQRLDKLLVRELGVSRAEARRLFDDGCVRMGTHRVSKGDVAQATLLVSVELRDAEDGGAAVPEAEPARALVVLLERADVVVVDKPAGQPSAPLRAGETGTVANALVGRYPEMAKVGFAPREPGLVHRLDNDTSGVLVAARTRRAFDALVAGLKRGALDKTYLAVCHDDALPDQGSIEIPLAPHPKDKRRVLACLHPRDVERLSPRPAQTRYEVKERGNGLALVKVWAPKALRHQIRAHLAAIGCPIAGDSLYGSHLSRDKLGRHALHAASVTWKGDPDVPAFLTTSPLPPELEALLRA